MAVPSENLPNRIREHRKRRGMTQQQLADRLGLTKPAVGMLERGDRPLTIDRQRAIARELGVEMVELLDRKDHRYALSADERRLIDYYRSVDAVARRTVSNVAENLAEWTNQPLLGEDDKKKS